MRPMRPQMDSQVPGTSDDLPQMQITLLGPTKKA